MPGSTRRLWYPGLHATRSAQATVASVCDDSKRERDARSLIDRAFGIELERDISAADQRRRDPCRFEARDELAARILARADHHRVDVEHLGLTVHDDMQARIVDLHVFDAGEHRHAAPAQQG